MKVTYIGHSGFSVEFEESFLVFDYYEGEIPEVAREKKKYYFVSHKHQDHFNHRIFQAAIDDPQVTYILSNDTKMTPTYMGRLGIPKEAMERIRYARKSDSFMIGDSLQVETIRSTDEGVAFLIQYTEQGKTTSIYHAGDLNWWSWRGETKEEYEEMKRAFFTEMEKLKDRKFDLAFVPLDPRQEERFWWGFDAFMKTAEVKRVFPMHCWGDDYTVIDRILEMKESESYRDRIVKITKRGESFTFES